MRGHSHFRDCMVMVLIGLTACCATALMGCSGSGDSADSTESVASEVPGETGSPTAAAAPVVVLSPDDWQPPTPTEADILADRILREEDENSLLLDPTERRQLAAEIDSVLSSIRDAYPAFADITVRMPYAFGELLVGLESQLFDEVASLLEGQAGPVTLQTGYAAFDSLNADLELSVVVDLFPSFHAVTLYFSEYLNVPAAAAAYGRVDGVEYAESNTYVGGGPDPRGQVTRALVRRGASCRGRLPGRLHCRGIVFLRRRRGRRRDDRQRASPGNTRVHGPRHEPRLVREEF